MPLTTASQCCECEAVETLHQGGRTVRLHQERCVGCPLSTCHLRSFFNLYTHPWTSSGAQGVPLPREDRAARVRASLCVCVCVCVCGLPVLTTAVILEPRCCRCGETHWKSARNDWRLSFLPPPRFLKSCLSRRWTWDSASQFECWWLGVAVGENAKGCLEAVKATAGEYPIKKAKKGFFWTQMRFHCVQCSFLRRCSLMWAEAKILERMQLNPGLSGLLWRKHPSNMWILVCPWRHQFVPEAFLNLLGSHSDVKSAKISLEARDD